MLNSLREHPLFDKIMEKKHTLILIIGIFGILLIFLSTIFENKPEKSVLPKEHSNGEYIEMTEHKLLKILGTIQGVGRVKLMITLENGIEKIYLVDEKDSIERVDEMIGEENKKIQQTQNIEKKHIIVDGKNGKEPIIRTEKEPVIKGVVVVFEGADSAIVSESVMQAVKTALNITTNRICIAKME
ncbi:MAG: hypothetical protein RSB96_00155 [Oscillospiraceae bacterium]